MKKNPKRKRTARLSFSLVIFTCVLWSCGNDPVPKPRGYFRIDFPERSYEDYYNNCPYSFEKPTYSIIRRSKEDSCWFNMYYPDLRATVHFTYLPIRDNLAAYMDDSYNFAYQHNMKSTGIDRIGINRPEEDVYGLIYELKGDVASPLQFYMTDSSNHFLRGAVYFNLKPNADSLAPSLNFIRQDIKHIIESTSWQE